MRENREAQDWVFLVDASGRHLTASRIRARER